MKNPLHILLILFIAFLTYGCANHPPESYFGAKSSYDADYFDHNDTLEFKYAFRYLMPRNERLKLENTLKNTVHTSDAWTKKMQSDGFNALAISAAGTNAFSSGGQAAGLGLSLIDSYLTSRSERKRFSYMVFSNEWLGGTYTDVADVREAARKLTLMKIEETAKAFDYKMKCIANCDKNMATFELISTNQAKYKNTFHPEQLGIDLYLGKVEKIEDGAIEQKIFSEDSHYQAPFWDIILSGAKTKIEYNAVESSKGERKMYGEDSYLKSNKTYNIHLTPFGRKFLKHFSKKMQNWVMADACCSYEVAILNGELYNPTQESSVKRFRGARTVEYN